MAITARKIIFDAQATLQDVAGDRWPASELVSNLNKAQRDIHTARPDTTAVLTELTLAAGFRQSLPAAASSLIDIPANSTGESVTKTDLPLLDASDPGWRRRPGSRVIRHFMHDLRNPRVVLVYPPAAAGAKVDIEYSAYPADVPAPSGDGKAYTTVTGGISLADKWETALWAMVLHYAYAKDAEFGGNAGLSTAYLSRAEAILGVEIQSTATVAPST